jgi:hypothetical protein
MMEIVVTALIGFAGVVAGAYITGLWQRKKSKAETDKTAAEANEQIRETVMSLIGPLEKKIKGLEKELAIWKCWALALAHQVKEMGGEPIPFQ